MTTFYYPYGYPISSTHLCLLSPLKRSVSSWPLVSMVRPPMCALLHGIGLLTSRRTTLLSPLSKL